MIYSYTKRHIHHFCKIDLLYLSKNITYMIITYNKFSCKKDLEPKRQKNHSKYFYPSLLFSLFVFLTIFISLSFPISWAFETQSTDLILNEYIDDAARFYGAKPIHQDITKTALPFINEKSMRLINIGHEYADFIKENSYNPAFHFDNCQFSSSILNINRLYDEILKDLNPLTPSKHTIRSEFGTLMAVDDIMLIQFGMLLHIVQDFYSHSNWVEMGRTDLIDEGYEKWTILSPYDIVKGSNIVVIEGDNIPPGYTLKRSSEQKIVTVNDSQRGLISGLAADTKGCPSSISIGHYDPTESDKKGISVKSKIKSIVPSKYLGQGLNKDEYSRPLFSVAKKLAIEQTEHEWCRLLNLVDKAYPDKGKEKILDAWVGSLARIKECPEKWKGDYYDKIKMLYESGKILNFSNSGSFSLYVHDDNSITGKGSGQIKSPFYSILPKFDFSIAGFYEEKTNSIRLKFSGFSNFSPSPFKSDELGVWAQSNIHPTILYRFYDEPKLIGAQKFLGHDSLCEKFFSTESLVKDIRESVGYDHKTKDLSTTSSFASSSPNISPEAKKFLEKYSDKQLVDLGRSFGDKSLISYSLFLIFGDPGYIPFCKEPAIDMSIKNKKIKIHNEYTPDDIPLGIAGGVYDLFGNLRGADHLSPLGIGGGLNDYLNLKPQKIIEDHEIKLYYSFKK